MLLSHIMTTRLVTVTMDDRLTVVKEIFDKASIHHVLVVDGEVLTGVISDRDLLKAISYNVTSKQATAKDLATLNKRAHHIMTRNVITLTANATIFDAVSTFNRHTISCIPIIDRHCHPIGIVSWRDIMKALEKLRKSKQAPAV
ncbi:CBS domain-containing protein [Aestuariibacter halophilus]|uniref:CBS domain-containing protein n=1 Tax=Fluctibacter halophilus TaxID=226011 RepID=A0ABS8G630_9ALTE|nr:CBS domain-containing protein [Aestuariibacter halophilus]MCC2616052.1 CBS domain-containing protein [Aestuariibacter halophilus]